MFFNFDKCHSMSIGRSPGLFSYTIESPDRVVTLATTSEERDLVVLITSNLKFGQKMV